MNDADSGPKKIFVRTERVDGYPPEEWEGIWALPAGDGRFKIDNIPFYAKNLSCDDIVEVVLEDNKYVIRRVVKTSENSTIRVVVYDLSHEAYVRDILLKLGCSIEGTGIPGLIAVNVPKHALDDVIDFLEDQFAEDRVDFEEGALR